MTQDNDAPRSAEAKIEQHLNRLQQDLTGLANDNLAYAKLPKLDPSRYLPWTQSAIRPASLALVLNEIQIHNRKFIVECGSGISTLYIARVIEGTGTKLVSIDNDKGWQDVVRRQAQQMSVNLEPVEFIEAPLTPCDHSPSGLHWYDTERIKTSLPSDAIDLLLVDGPIAGGRALAESRYPALPFFREKLADDFAIFLDDCNRAGEQKIAQSWCQQFKLKGQFLPNCGNVALFFPPKSKRFNII